MDYQNRRSQVLISRQLLMVGVGLATVAIIGLVLPGSALEYTEPIHSAEPLTSVYGDTQGRVVFVGTLGTLCLLFAGALYLASGLSSVHARRSALAMTVPISIVFALAYSSGSHDLYHNISDVRTLWVYGDNPMLTPPTAHDQDAFYPRVLAWRDSVSAYGPLFYALGVPFSVMAGGHLLLNILALKAMNGLGLIILVWLVGAQAERLAPGRGVVATVAVGWNPFILWETMTNGHNDVLMMAFAIGALALASHGLVSQSLIGIVLSVMIKYLTGVLGVLVVVWGWRRAQAEQRRAMVSVVFSGTLAAAACYLIYPDTLDELRSFITTDRVWRSPTSLMTVAVKPVVGNQLANDLARYLCWTLVLGFFGFAIRSLDGTLRSLYQASFISLVAFAVLLRPEFFAWYFIWFIPLGAILIGSWEWRLSFFASVGGLLAYAVFPWSPDSVSTNALYVAFVLVAPPLALVTFQILRRSQVDRIEVAAAPST